MFALVGWIIIMFTGLWFLAVSISIVYWWYLLDRVWEGMKKSWPVVVPFSMLGIAIIYYSIEHVPFNITLN